MLRYVNHGSVKVTWEWAMETLTKRLYVKQRNRIPKAIAYYDALIRSGRMQTTVFTFAVLNGQWMLINGQQRLAAELLSGIPFDGEIRLCYCDSEEDVKIAYDIEDSNERRPPGQMDRIYDTAKMLGVSNPEARAIEKAVAVLMTGFERLDPKRTPLASRLSVQRSGAMEWKSEAGRYFEATRKHHVTIPTKSLRKPAVIAVFMVLMREKTEQAFEFAESTALFQRDKSEASHELAAALSSVTYSTELSTVRLSRLVAACWNAFLVEGKPNTRLNPNELKVPIYLAGTPYDGRSVRYYTPSSWEFPEADPTEPSTAVSQTIREQIGSTET